MPEWLNGAVSKTVVRLLAYRGFESHPLRQFKLPRLETGGGITAEPLTGSPESLRGGVPEWLIGHAWKACVPHGTVGSNPTPSAIKTRGREGPRSTVGFARTGARWANPTPSASPPMQSAGQSKRS